MKEPPAHDHSSRERLIGNHETANHETANHETAKHDMAKREMAKRDTKDEHPDSKVARRDAADKMHWVKGPQPAAEAHGREKALAAADRAKAEKLAKAEQLRAAKKTAKLEASDTRKTAQAETGHPTGQAIVRQQPVKMAKVDDAPIKKAATDPTPTASLPPSAVADKPMSANGNPEFRWPAHGRIIQGFKSGGNDGINIAVPEGTQVKAAESGVVAYAGNEIKGFGNLVLIRPSQRLRHRLRQQRQPRGQARRAGQARSDDRGVRPERQRRLAPAALRSAQGIDACRPDPLPRRSLRSSSTTRETRAVEDVGRRANSSPPFSVCRVPSTAEPLARLI